MFCSLNIFFIAVSKIQSYNVWQGDNQEITSLAMSFTILKRASAQSMNAQESEGTRPDHQQGGCGKFERKQLNKQIRKYKGSNSYTAPFARFEYQIDIMDMKPFTKEPGVAVPIKNDEPRYAMVVIDIFSELANAVPMKEKSGPNALFRHKILKV